MTRNEIRFIHNNETNIFSNLAIDHAIFDISRILNTPTIRIWRNKPSLVLGRTQIFEDEVNEKYCNENDIEISRRISGGGCVYHDLGNLNISYYLPWRLIPSERNIFASTKYFTTFLKQSLENMKYENLRVYNTSSIIYGDQKVSGSAGHTKSGWVLHHCTLLFKADLNHLENSLLVKDRNPDDKRRSEYYPTINLPNFSISKFKSILINTAKKKFHSEINDGTITKRELEFKEKLEHQLYEDASWIYRGKRKLIREK